MALEHIFSPEELKTIAAYHRPHDVWAAVRDGWWLLTSALILRYSVTPLYRAAERVCGPPPETTSGWRRAIDRMWGGQGWAPALVFTFLSFALSVAINLPLTVYFGYVHEKRFGMSNESLGRFLADMLVEHAVTVMALSALTFGLFGLARKLERWWLVLGLTAAAALSLSAAVDPYRARVLYEQRPLPQGELRERIVQLMKKADVDFADVLVEKTLRSSPRIQAYFAGTGPTRTIVLNDALLERLKTDEVLAAVAHEAGHVRERRWPSVVLSGVAMLAFVYAVDRLMRRVARAGWWGITHRADVRVLPLIFIVFSLATRLVAPVSGYVSRERELAADTYAIELTENPEAFSRMLVAAARINKMNPSPPGWVVWRGWSHPPVVERLAHVDEVASRFR